MSLKKLNWKWIALGLVVLVLAGGLLRTLAARKAQQPAAAAGAAAQPVVELAQTDVVQAQQRELQRGVERGEFRAIDIEYTVFSIVAPMVYLTMMKHSLGACVPQDFEVDPERYVETQVQNLLHGLCVRPAENKA